MSSANQPSDSGKKAAGRLIDFAVRQYLREDGTFLDIPADILPNPPTKPIQFLHLEHYFMAPSGLKKDLGECAGPEEAVDILANELAAMQLLLRGYFTHLERYVAKFDGQHEELQKEILSLGESYMGLRMLAQPACAQSKAVSYVSRRLLIHISRRPCLTAFAGPISTPWNRRSRKCSPTPQYTVPRPRSSVRTTDPD